MQRPVKKMKPTAAEMQAIMHADPATGSVNASGARLRDELRRKGYAKSVRRGRELVLTSAGWRWRERLLREHKPFTVAGVPWEMMQLITDLYLSGGLQVEEISHRTKTQIPDVEKVLEHRGVLVD
ncbi:hypothetical protein ACPCSE_29435 [Streptomyces cellulosae]